MDFFKLNFVLSCLDAYFFTNSDTTLTIKPESFTYVEGRSYQFLIIGTSPYGSYEQLVKINIVNYVGVPTVTLGYVNYLNIFLVSIYIC